MTNEALWLVMGQIEVAGEPVTTTEQAREVLALVGLPTEGLENEQQELGLWLFALRADDASRLEEEGFMEWTATLPFGAVASVTVEMP